MVGGRRDREPLAWCETDRGRLILELGGGLGSAALTLLERLERGGRLKDVERYDFTELVPAFLRRGQRALAERFDPFQNLTVHYLLTGARVLG